MKVKSTCSYTKYIDLFSFSQLVLKKNTWCHFLHNYAFQILLYNVYTKFFDLLFMAKSDAFWMKFNRKSHQQLIKIINRLTCLKKRRNNSNSFYSYANKIGYSENGKYVFGCITLWWHIWHGNTQVFYFIREVMFTPRFLNCV